MGLLFLWYFVYNLHMAMRIGRAIRRVNEDTYADIDDFPTRTGEKMQWIPTSLCILLAVNFFIDNPGVKACRDVLFALTSVWFCIYTLNPRRKPFETLEGAKEQPQPEEGSAYPLAGVAGEDAETEPSSTLSASEEPGGGSTSRLSDERYAELSQRLETLLTDDCIFTEQHITAATLMQRLGINANYLTEVIQRSGYASFYDMICQHRVRHAISLIHKHPGRRLADIADLCGFSSPSSMAKAFAAQGKQSPSAYRHR